MMNNLKEKSQLHEAFDPKAFKENGYKVIDIISEYLEKATTGSYEKVLPYISPDEMLEIWPADFDKKESLETLFRNSIHNSNKLANPRYIGHQVSIPLPSSAFSQALAAVLNNSSVVYEMGPVNTAMEKNLISWMCNLAGYNSNSDGVFTSGGTLGNFTSLLAARQSMAGYDIWNDGVKQDSLVVLVSEHAHYSVKRAVQIMGLGENAALLIKSDDEYKMNLTDLAKKYQEVINSGKQVLAVVANGCSTATGTYDDINVIADFCEFNDIWLHVDGAHGASALISDKYKHLLKGINRADSICWDAHKMMMMPALITAVLFKDGNKSYEAFQEKASYLFEKEAKDEWYNYGHRTMECTKGMMGLKLYIALKMHGKKVFSDFIDYSYDLASEFAQMLKDSSDFEIPVEPMSNIVCFRYTGSDKFDLDEMQKRIRAKIFEQEKFYICQAELKDGLYLRVTLMNPFTDKSYLGELLNDIRKIAAIL